MRRDLCQMWNLSRAELRLEDARSILHDTALIRLFEAETERKAAANRAK